MTSFITAASAAFPMLQQGFGIDLSALGHFVRIIVEGVGVVGIGVIVFTLILKAITTPFEIYQRVNMRKQTLIMRNMQPELEKLQKQYADDKNTYSRKMMELQKKNGYSMLGACLPMLISLVILIIAVMAFQSYAQYANLSMYRSMAESYNSAVMVYAVNEETQEEDTIIQTPYLDGETQRMRVESSKGDIYLYYTYEIGKENARKDYYVDLEKFYYNQENTSFKAEVSDYIKNYIEAKKQEGTTVTESDACVAWFQNIGAAAAAEDFRKMNNPGFLWVKNVWYPDVSYNHPIQDYESFKSSFRSDIIDDYGNEVSIDDIITKAEYESLTSHLEEEKIQPNGYFILIILTIGLMVLSQFITMKSQKETNQYQTVDGQGARTQKMMMIMMPLIYAITGFLWTAAFSIYIAVSSIFGIVLTLVSNLIIGRIFRKKEEEALKARYTRTVPWRKDEGKDKKKK